MFLRSLLLGLAVLGLVLGPAGCGKDASAAARVATPAECRVVENGTTMVSPISGKTIVKQTSTPAAFYDGKLFFFCCAVDRDAFIQNPRTHAAGVLPPNAWVVETN